MKTLFCRDAFFFQKNRVMQDATAITLPKEKQRKLLETQLSMVWKNNRKTQEDMNQSNLRTAIRLCNDFTTYHTYTLEKAFNCMIRAVIRRAI
jgi:hypothetical protein